MERLTFGITYDYLCPFARNANEHVVAGMRERAGWDVTFVPVSLTQLKAAESGTPRWDDAGALRRSGVLALAVAEVVRQRTPERFLDVHLELFALRHDRAEDLRDPSSIAEALGRVGVDTALVDAASEGPEHDGPHHGDDEHQHDDRAEPAVEERHAHASTSRREVSQAPTTMSSAPVTASGCTCSPSSVTPRAIATTGTR